MKTKLMTLTPLLLIGSLSMACARADRSTAAPAQDDGNEAQTASTETSTPATEPESTEEEPASTTLILIEPKYTSVDPDILPVMRDACGFDRMSVYFETDSSELSTVGRAAISELAECLQLKAVADVPISIYGYADPRGTEPYNRELALERANAVKQALSDAGIDVGRIDSYSRGEDWYAEDGEDHDMERKASVKLDH